MVSLAARSLGSAVRNYRRERLLQTILHLARDQMGPPGIEGTISNDLASITPSFCSVRRGFEPVAGTYGISPQLVKGFFKDDAR